MKSHRLYTGADWSVVHWLLKNRSNLDAYTIYIGEGHYEGKDEESTIVEVIGNDQDFVDMKQLASDIIAEAGEKEVLLTSHEVEVCSIP